MTSYSGKQMISIHILPNVSRSKENQKMKFVQFIEYDMRNVFHTQNAVETLLPDPFLKS